MPLLFPMGHFSTIKPSTTASCQMWSAFVRDVITPGDDGDGYCDDGGDDDEEQ